MAFLQIFWPNWSVIYRNLGGHGFKNLRVNISSLTISRHFANFKKLGRKTYWICKCIIYLCFIETRILVSALRSTLADNVKILNIFVWPSCVQSWKYMNLLSCLSTRLIGWSDLRISFQLPIIKLLFKLL